MAFAFHQYLMTRRSLRAEKAPGFPYGFRDTVGLQVTDPRLVARAYRDARGVTVIYYGTDAVTATLTVNKEELGFAGLGVESFRVSLGKHEAGYKIMLA